MNESIRVYSTADRLIAQADRALRTLFGQVSSARPSPADRLPHSELSAEQRRHAARLMRINHSGEVCAQALYQGQAVTARLATTRQRLEQSAAEENDHLAWCEQRLRELDDRKSLLNPLWYTGSFAIGALAGAIGERWSLGFVVETERQVESHLDEHLAQLPPQDEKSRTILEQMKRDEMHHAQAAREAGAAELPRPARRAMRMLSKVMTGSAYWV